MLKILLGLHSRHAPPPTLSQTVNAVADVLLETWSSGFPSSPAFFFFFFQ